MYPHQIAFNVLPEIDVFRDDGYTKEEWKVIAESRKILHLPELRVSCTAVRVPVFAAHSEAVHVETRDPITPGPCPRAVRATCRAWSSWTTRRATATRWPSTPPARDDIYVGPRPQDTSRDDGRGLAFWVVSDNIRKGAATNAVQIAEILRRARLAGAGIAASRAGSDARPRHGRRPADRPQPTGPA